MLPVVVAVGTYGTVPVPPILAVPILIAILLAVLFIGTFLAGLVYGPVLLLIVRRKRHLFWIMPLLNIAVIAAWLIYDAIAYGNDLLPREFNTELVIHLLVYFAMLVLLTITGWVNAAIIATFAWRWQARRSRKRDAHLMRR